MNTSERGCVTILAVSEGLYKFCKLLFPEIVTHPMKILYAHFKCPFFGNLKINKKFCVTKDALDANGLKILTEVVHEPDASLSLSIIV